MHIHRYVVSCHGKENNEPAVTKRGALLNFTLTVRAGLHHPVANGNIS